MCCLSPDIFEFHSGGFQNLIKKPQYHKFLFKLSNYLHYDLFLKIYFISLFPARSTCIIQNIGTLLLVFILSQVFWRMSEQSLCFPDFPLSLNMYLLNYLLPLIASSLQFTPLGIWQESYFPPSSIFPSLSCL